MPSVESRRSDGPWAELKQNSGWADQNAERIVLKVWVLSSYFNHFCLWKGIHKPRIAEARTSVLIHKAPARNNIVAAMYVIEVLVIAKRYCSMCME